MPYSAGNVIDTLAAAKKFAHASVVFLLFVFLSLYVFFRFLCVCAAVLGEQSWPRNMQSPKRNKDRRLSSKGAAGGLGNWLGSDGQAERVACYAK